MCAGKYGYVDVNGDVKIIQYGADAMGFQPQGDLPEGIIIPPPVSGNCTDCGDYDYDAGGNDGREEASRDQERFQAGKFFFFKGVSTVGIAIYQSKALFKAYHRLA